MTSWYYKLGDQAIGPMDAKQLKQLAASQRLQPDDLVRMGDDGEWVPATRVKGLFPPPVATAIPVQSDASGGQSSTSGVFDVDFSQKHKTKKEINIPIAAPPVPTEKATEAIPVASKPSSAKSAEVVNFNFASGAVDMGKTTSSRNPAGNKPGVDAKASRSGEPTPAELKALKKKKQQQMTVILGSVCGVGVVVLLAVVILFSSGNKTKPSDETTIEAVASNPSEAAVPSNTVAGDVAATNPDAPNPAAPVSATDPADPAAVASAGGEEESASFFDATKDAAKFGNLEIKIRSVKRGQPVWEPIPGKSVRPKETDDNCIIIELSVLNTNPTRIGKFTPWSGSIARGAKSIQCSLKDNNTPSNEYSCKNKLGIVFKDVDPQTQELIAGDPPVLDVLVFGRPVPQFDYLELKLNDPTGDKIPPVLFRIPKSMIGTAAAVEEAEKPNESAAENADGVTQETGSPQDLVPEDRGIPLGDDEPESVAPGASQPVVDPAPKAGSEDSGLDEGEKAMQDELGELMDDEPTDTSGLQVDPAMKAQGEQMAKENDERRNAENMEKTKKLQKELKKK